MSRRKKRKRSICIVTGSRAEYGLLYWLIKQVESDQSLELQLIVTGMHLSPEFGLTYKEIEKEFKINKKINMSLSSDTSVGISKSMAIAQKSIAEAYSKLKPDIIVLLGDRYEIFASNDFKQNPIANNICIKVFSCASWEGKEKLIFIGDFAEAIAEFQTLEGVA